VSPQLRVASAWEKHSFADKSIPKYNLGMRGKGFNAVNILQGCSSISTINPLELIYGDAD